MYVLLKFIVFIFLKRGFLLVSFINFINCRINLCVKLGYPFVFSVLLLSLQSYLFETPFNQLIYNCICACMILRWREHHIH